MLTQRIRRKYLLPIEGPTGLDPLNERILRALHIGLTPEEVKQVLPNIPGLSKLVVMMLPPPLSDAELCKKYDLPPPGPQRINGMRMSQLIQADRRIRMFEGIPNNSGYIADDQKIIRGVLLEQRFVMAWTHNGFRQPGVRLVRPATDTEDLREETDAVMECENGKTCRFQIKGGWEEDFYGLAMKDIVLVRVKLDNTPEQMRHAAIESMREFARFKLNQNQLLPIRD
jgi:hypothetical protein